MLKHRIIPVLLTDGTQAVKPVAFQRPYRKLGAMEQYIQVIERRNVDELIIIDIEATAQGRKPNYDKLRRWCANVYCPVTYGGGIATLDDIRMALENGADKVAIWYALKDYEFLEEASKKFGSQAIVAVVHTNFDYAIEPRDSVSLANYFKDIGAGEILLNDCKHEGRMLGYDINIIRKVSQFVSIPIIALGGCGEPEHMKQAIEAGASAVAAASMFLYTDTTPKDCAEYLHKNNIPVRLHG